MTALEQKIKEIQRIFIKRLNIELTESAVLRIFSKDEDFNNANVEDFDDTYYRDYFIDLFFLDIIGMRAPLICDSQEYKDKFKSEFVKYIERMEE